MPGGIVGSAACSLQGLESLIRRVLANLVGLLGGAARRIGLLLALLERVASLLTGRHRGILGRRALHEVDAGVVDILGRGVAGGVLAGRVLARRVLGRAVLGRRAVVCR